MASLRVAQNPFKHVEPYISAVNTSVITRKGQITIPAEIRNVLGLEIGQRVSIRLEGSTILVERSIASVEKMYGMLSTYANPANRTRAIQEIIDEEKEAFAQAVIDDALGAPESA